MPLLIQKGADVNRKDEKGSTPLMIAAYLKDKENVKRLLNAGADATAVNQDGQTFRNLSNLVLKLTYCQHTLTQKIKQAFHAQNQRSC